MRVRAPIWTYPLRIAAIVFVLGMIATGVRATQTSAASIWLDPEAVIVRISSVILAPLLDVPVDAAMDRWRPGWSKSAAAPSPLARRYAMILGPRTLAKSPLDCVRATWSSVAPWLQMAGVSVAASAATFVALPIVRRRAKVRWSHIHRAAVYALGIVPIIAVTCWLLDSISASRFRASPWHIADRFIHGEVALLPLFLLVWWWAASRQYLRLDRPVAVALSVAVVGTLVGFVVLYLTSEQDVIFMIQRIGVR